MSKVVLITGASSGMGKMTALLLAKEGFTVYAGVRSNYEELKEDIKVLNLDIKTVFLDVQNLESIQEAVKGIIAKEGKLDVLVNNAGYGLLSSFEDANDEEIFKQFDVNVFGLIKMTREVLPFMRKQQSGVIINISSFLGKMGLPLLSAYNASKYAVEGITDSLRFEVNQFNIRVHTIQASLYATNFVKKGLAVNKEISNEQSAYKDLIKHFSPIVATAINEGPTPEPIAQAVLHLINNEDAKISLEVGVQSETFLPLKKELSNEAFEEKVKETFAL